MNSKKPLKESILLGLTVLTTLMRRGDELTYRDIADVCDCSPQAIIGIEKRALAKVRARMEALDL